MAERTVHRRMKARRGGWRVLLAALAAAYLFLSPSPALAQCETSEEAERRMGELQDEIIDIVDRFIAEMASFIDYDVDNTATKEFQLRLDQYNEALYAPLQRWLGETWAGLQGMTAQLSFAKMEQTMRIGMFIDARRLNEKIRKKKFDEVSAYRRYTPADTLSSCQMATVGEGQVKAYHMSRAMTRALALEDTKRRNNYLEEPLQYASGDDKDGLLIRSAHAALPVEDSKARQINELWEDYVTRYCDPEAGDQGCGATPGTHPGVWSDLGAFLWGDHQTFNMGDADTQKNVKDSLRMVISPFAPEPIPARALESPPGREEMLARRARDTRLNAIYNALGQMMAERMGGSGTDTQSIRTVSGLPEHSERLNSSYSEIRDALSKSRVFGKDYVTRLVNDMAAVKREQTVVNAIQGQLINDMYKRMEEMVVLEAAAYAEDLDRLTSTFNTSQARPMEGAGFLPFPPAGPAPGTPGYGSGYGAGPGAMPGLTASFPTSPGPGIGPPPAAGPTLPPGPGGAPTGTINYMSNDQVLALAGMPSGSVPTEKIHVAYGCPTYIVLHHTGTPRLEDSVHTLAGPKDRTYEGVPLSTHYIVNKDGTVLRIAPENVQTNHAGPTAYEGLTGTTLSQNSIGIEIQASRKDIDTSAPFPEEQINAVGLLVRDIMSRHGIPKDNVVAHVDTSLSGKIDPYHTFPWAQMAGWNIGVYPSEAARAVFPDDNQPRGSAVIDALLGPLPNGFGFDPHPSRPISAMEMRWPYHFDYDASYKKGWAGWTSRRIERLLQDVIAQKQAIPQKSICPGQVRTPAW